jgi:copper chaperone CopZ
MFNVKPLRTLIPVLAMATLGSACAPEARSAAQAPDPAGGVTAAAGTGAPAGDVIQTVRIPVEGMSCVACAANVKKTLVAIGGVEEVEVHLGERNARVRFNSRQITPDRLVAAINGLGYSAGTPVASER